MILSTALGCYVTVNCSITALGCYDSVNCSITALGCYDTVNCSITALCYYDTVNCSITALGCYDTVNCSITALGCYDTIMILSTTLCCLLWGHSDIKPLVTTLSPRCGVPLVQVAPLLQAPQNLPASTEWHSQWNMLRGGEVRTWLLTGKPSSPIRPWGPLSPTAPWQTAGSEHHITSYIPLHHIILYIPLHHVTLSQTVLPLKPLLLYCTTLRYVSGGSRGGSVGSMEPPFWRVAFVQ